MKKTLLKILSFVFLICLTVGCLGVTSVFASTTVSQDYSDEYGGKNFADKWTANGAELYTEYSALRLVDVNVWSPGINLVGHTVTANSVITFDAKFISGQWLGVAFGLYSQTGKFPTATSALILTSGATQIMTKSSSELSQTTMKEYATFPSVFAGVNKTVTIKIEIDEAGVIKIFSALKGEALEFKGSYANCFTEGYMALSGMGNTFVDITEFSLDVQGENVYTADFTQDTVSYSSSGFDANSNWYVSTSHWKKNNANIEDVNVVKVSEGDFLSYKTPITDNGVSETTFRASLTMAITSLDEGAFFGVGFGRTTAESPLTENAFVGFGRRGDLYYLASIVDGEIYEIKGSYFGAMLGIGSGSVNVTFEGLYGDRLRVSFGTESVEFSNVFFNGLLAIGCYAKDGEATAAVAFDNFTMEKATHRVSLSDDVSNDFKGLKTWTEYGTEFKEYYVNKYEYYLGSSVKLPRYGTDAYGNFVDRNYVQFINTNNLSVFAPKKDYGDFILRFSFTVSGDDPLSASNDARIGFALGMPSIYYSPTSSPFFCFQKGDKTNARAVGRNMLDENGLSNAYVETEYDIWSATPETYNVMAVVEDGTVKVYYKKDSEPESMMSVLRHTFKADNTYGYVGVFGYDGSTFTMTDFSITNITPEKFEGVIDGKVGENEFVSASELADGEALTASKAYENYINFTELKTDGNATVSFNLGGKTLSLSKSGLVYDASQLLVEVNEFDYSDIKDKALVRTMVSGDVFEIGIRSNGSESQLYKPVIKGRLIDKQSDATMSVSSSDGKTAVYSFKSVSLETDIPLSTHNYDEAYENSFNQIVIKPEIDEGDSGCSSSIEGCYVAVVGVVLCAVFVIARRKKCRK